MRDLSNPEEKFDWKVSANLIFIHFFQDHSWESADDADAEWEKFDDVRIVMTPSTEDFYSVYDDPFNSTEDGMEVDFEVNFLVAASTREEAAKQFFARIQDITITIEIPYKDEIKSEFNNIAAVKFWDPEDQAEPLFELNDLSPNQDKSISLSWQLDNAGKFKWAASI